MLNGKIDLSLIIFTLGQYIVVIFGCYLCFKGFLSFIKDARVRRFENMQRDIEYYDMKLELAKKKHIYKEYVRGLKNNDIPDDLVSLDIPAYSQDTSDISEENNEEEVDIPTLNELIEKEGDFLSHSEDAELKENKVYEFQNGNNDDTESLTSTIVVDTSSIKELKEDDKEKVPKRKWGIFNLFSSS